MALQITTYTRGFDMKFQRTITRKDFISICNRLACSPEQASGGGFLQLDNELGYKTMRLHIQGFPWITSTTMEEWQNDESDLIKEGTKTNTTIKAFHGAPAWTLEELQYHKEILEEYGIQCLKMPTARALVYRP